MRNRGNFAAVKKKSIFTPSKKKSKNVSTKFKQAKPLIVIYLKTILDL